MKAKLSKMLIVAVVTLSTVECVRAEMAMNGKVLQAFEFGNDGNGVVSDIKIQYGDFVIPTLIYNNKFGPDHVVTFSETMTIPIPESAKIHWISADGKAHEVTTPIRTFVHNPQCLDGFRFMFVDDHVNLYRINRKGDCTKLFDVETVKVFSSKPSQ